MVGDDNHLTQQRKVQRLESAGFNAYLADTGLTTWAFHWKAAMDCYIYQSCESD